MGLSVYHVCEETIKAESDAGVYDDQVGMMEMVVNPNSEYLKELPSHLRSYEEAVNYLSNNIML